MKVKKKIGLLLAFVMTATAAMPLMSGCSLIEKIFHTSNEWDKYADEQLAQGEVRCSVEDDSLYIRWAEVSGAEGYKLYTCVSRFGTYTAVSGAEKVNDTHYKASNALYNYYKVMALKNGKEVEVGEPVSVFSTNTLIVSPKDDMTAVQEYIDEKHNELESNFRGQFSSTRVAVMFLPGEYSDITMKLGYYTSAYGLGDLPTDVVVNELYVSDQVLSNQNATCTFWRSAENFTVDGDTVWAVSQATSMRRMQINGNLALSYDGWSSGGFLANSYVTGSVNSGSQQQWMSRNDEWGAWPATDGGHNYVFSGCLGNTPADNWKDGSAGRMTNIEKTEKMAEKPFLVYNGSSGYDVFVPDVEKNTQGTTWRNGSDNEAGTYLSLNSFYVADAAVDNDVTLNAALQAGKHLLLTPGQYRLNAPLKITNKDTVVMGIGYATLKITDTNKTGAIVISDVDGVRVGDILVDAGVYSKNMIVVGEEGKNTSHAANPIVLSNIYLRIGGVENVHTETDQAMVIHANDTLGDNFWIWRADHSQGVAWDDTENEEGTSYGNPVDIGLLVNGDNVACYALMVEHCEGYQTYWKGENGMTVMYQCETPYNVPDQESWMSPDGKQGRAAYKVDNDVTSHRGYGIGIYLVNYSGVTLDSAIEVPDTSGINMYHLVTCSFAASKGSTIASVINGIGSWVGEGSSRRLVEKYPQN